MRFWFLIIIFSSLASWACAQPRIMVSGSQVRIPMQNAELGSTPVTLSRTMVIDSVSGSHNGFWIVKGSKTEKAFWTERFAKNSIGYVLGPGVYCVYPNLRTDSDTATVTIWLRKK